jgi:hypothetical protein
VTRNYSKEKGAPAGGESFKDVVNGRGKGISRRLAFVYIGSSVLSVISGALESRSCDDPCLFVPAAMGLQMFYSKTATPELYSQAAAGGGMIRSHRAGGGHTNHQIREVATPVLPRPVPVCVSSS